MMEDRINLTQNDASQLQSPRRIQTEPMLPSSKKSNLNPMSPLAASATVVNLLLATGPFTYPYGYVSLGPVVAAPLLFITCFLAYITATYMVEAISIAQVFDDDDSRLRRTESLFNEECYTTPQQKKDFNDKDAEIKESEFYIRQKLELGVIAERIARPWLKITIMIILVIYVYGALSLKYVTGAESLYQGISFIAYDSEGELYDKAPWVYYASIGIFAVLSIGFSFGDISDSKMVQIVVTVIRVVVIVCMYCGTIYYWADDGTHKAQTIDWSNQLPNLATVFGNTVFTFIYHHSIPGIVYPIRPQSVIPKMFLISNIFGAIMLFIEAQLAWYAFSGLTNSCEATPAVFPCAVDPKGFNQNFAGIPVLGAVVQFYPMLNVAAVPILTITLRNNLMQVLPIKRWLGNCDCSFARFLLQDDRKLVKGVWSIFVSIPAIVIVCFTKNPQVIVTYTGGICGTFILFIIPCTLLVFSRNKLKNNGNFGEVVNPNKSWFQSLSWTVIILIWALITIVTVLIRLVNSIIKSSGGGGGE